MLRTSSVRSDLRATSIARSSGVAVWTNTKDASPTATLVPMPMLMFDFKSAGSMTFARSVPVQREIPKSFEDPAPAPGTDWDTEPTSSTEPTSLVEELPIEPAAALSEAPDVSEPPEAAEPEPQPAGETHRIELIIDSLPRHQLIESIPVTIDSLGDQVFTATIYALNLTGTGNTLGDALIIVKDQLEILYEKLTKTSNRDDEEKKHWKYLQSHIKEAPAESPRHSKRSLWR